MALVVGRNPYLGRERTGVPDGGGGCLADAQAVSAFCRLSVPDSWHKRLLQVADQRGCHKKPHSWFREDWLTLPACVDALSSMIEDLFLENPKLKIVFTISPYRYAKYGFHGNQVAKSTLIMAVEEVMKKYPQQVSYFPAYEIVLDELRDYRFYAEDMLHPSGVAVDYIWQRLTQSVMNPDMQEYLQEYAPIRSGLSHKPINPESAAYKKFLTNLEEKAKILRVKYNME